MLYLLYFSRFAWLLLCLYYVTCLGPQNFFDSFISVSDETAWCI